MIFEGKIAGRIIDKKESKSGKFIAVVYDGFKTVNVFSKEKILEDIGDEVEYNIRIVCDGAYVERK